MHPANDPSRDQPLFQHLAATLTPLGYAVASYDRRPAPPEDVVPLRWQASDALAAVDWLRSRYGVPVGLWGFSQGAWAAGLAAAESDRVAFLALLGCPGVSPAEQMRYYTTELLRRAGYNSVARGELLMLRRAVEDLFRGDLDRDQAAELLTKYRQRPWFGLAHLPTELPAEIPPWTDMDFDPEPVYAKVRCPVLLIYGADEECVPIAPSVATWHRAASISANPHLHVVELPGLGHWPAPDDHHDLDNISTAYTHVLSDWFSTLSPDR